MVSLESLAFLLASITSLVFIYFKLPAEISQKAIAVLLLILLVIYKRFSSTAITNKLFRLCLLYLSALFIQLLVISSGGFYSPFLILLHLYTLGSSFLLKIGSAISFLVFSLIVLISTTFLNQTLLSLFEGDPGSAILYFVSFIVIIPLAQFLMSTYHIKDTISKILTETLAVGEKREQSILQGLNELVLVTDTNLKIISFNEAVEKSLNLENQIAGNNLLSILHLKDESGKDATIQSLSINQVLQNRATFIVKGFVLETKSNKNLKVSIQIKPVTNPKGIINQIAFVITDARIAAPSTHSTLEQAKMKQKMLLDNLKSTLDKAQIPYAETQVLLLTKLEEDLMMTQDLEDHIFKQETSLFDLVELCQKVKVKKESLARALHISLQLNFPKDEVEESAYLSLKRSNVSDEVLIPSPFSALIDPKWLTILLDKLIDISILLSLGGSKPAVNLSLTRESKVIVISITSYPVEIRNADKQNLFELYFGALANTYLKLGSGLEGVIAKTISSELKLPIEVQINKNVLTMSVKVSKGTN